MTEPTKEQLRERIRELEREVNRLWVKWDDAEGDLRDKTRSLATCESERDDLLDTLREMVVAFKPGRHEGATEHWRTRAYEDAEQVLRHFGVIV